MWAWERLGEGWGKNVGAVFGLGLEGVLLLCMCVDPLS